MHYKTKLIPLTSLQFSAIILSNLLVAIKATWVEGVYSVICFRNKKHTRITASGSHGRHICRSRCSGVFWSCVVLGSTEDTELISAACQSGGEVGVPLVLGSCH